MKSTYILIISIMTFLLGSTVNQAQESVDSIMMEAGYANDVYYSFENGEVHSADRTNWDIAFYTLTWSAGIIINDGNGVELKLYPNADTSGWNAVDTTGFSGWPALYNSVDSWEEGAFNVSATGHPDYGWGVYNTITHNVVGDSVYIIKLADATFKKLWIVQKISIQNTYEFRFANLDGSDQVNVTLNCSDYSDKNFVYYSLANQQVRDREPVADSWDILFTKYMGVLDGGVRYPVTGVLNNVDIPANRFEMVDPDFEDWSAAPMDSTKTPIGHDWKYFDMNTFSYFVEDSLVFFVRNLSQDVYKLVFTSFDYTMGKAVFEKKLIEASAVAGISGNSSILIYPNPAYDFIEVKQEKGFEVDQISLTDLKGSVLFRSEMSSDKITIPVDGFKAGLYLITVRSGEQTAVQKVLIR